MDIEKIIRIMDRMENSSIMSFQLKEGEDEIVLSKNKDQSPAQSVGAGSSAESPAVQEVQGPAGDYLKSPMIGTFYVAPAPDADPFVNVGDVIGKEQVVCIIEAMKMMTEIKAEIPGVIEEVLVANGEKVEFGQPLFRVKRG
ncbi:MAG: acetyl-CoA carboxylase biotin carboxyl carrier protein [Gallicola sp.]|nr:acetyl-CoA carboxylase biotin carboxyl carrier protein [Gallicola sp.]